MTYRTALISLALCLTPSSALASDFLTLLEQAKANPPVEAPKTIPYRYIIDINMSGEGDEDMENLTASVQVDPSAPAGQRTQIISTSDPENESLEEILKDIDGEDVSLEEMADEFWCGGPDGEDMDIDPSKIEILSETDAQVVLRPDPELMAELLSEGDEDMSSGDRKMQKKLSKRIDGTFTLSKPDLQLLETNIRLTRSMTVKVIAKIKAMEMRQTCTRAPNGFTYGSDMNMYVKAGALGVNFEQSVNMRVRDLQPL